jgi:Flavin containing amine oxidoreductase
MEKHRPSQRSPYDNLYLAGDYTKTHVSSGGMEAAIWTSNHCAELIAADKLEQSISLNVEFVPDRGLMPLIKPMMRYGPAAAAMLSAAAVARRKLRRSK